MDVDCVFTRELQQESYRQVKEEIILQELRDAVIHFTDACSDADLIEITTDGFKTNYETITPQPYVKATISCNNSPREDLIKTQVTIVGDAEYFTENIFPIKLLGPKYWASDELEQSIESQSNTNETQEQHSRVDMIAEKLYEIFN